MDIESLRQRSVLIPELYFLITKFLTTGPLKQTAKVLQDEIEKYKILPKRLDWEGNEHFQTFEELEQKFPHITAEHLLQICSRIGPILDREIPPSVKGVVSLLGAGRQSLLRTAEIKSTLSPLVEYGIRWKGKPLLQPVHAREKKHNIVNVLYGREYSGPTSRNYLISPNLFSKQQLLRRTLGHLSAVYCLLFDRTGLYIITGADDLLVKLWSTVDGRLLNTFRGASAEITDIDINFENSLLAAGSLDRLLRVWDLQTGAPVAVLSGHTGMITSVNFCPSPRWDLRYLITTSTDGSVAFWTYSYSKGNKASFMSKPLQYHERMRPGQAQMICASFSPGGMFLAAGSADHHVRVYLMHGDEGPHRILELEAHSDTVDSIQWAHHGLRFVSGSKDGTAHVWHFETQQWKSHQLLMNTRLPGTPPSEEENKKLKVTMVSWDCSDTWVITAVNDHTLKVWNADTGKLTKVLTGHHDEVYVLESHPLDTNILLSAGHDGQIFIWDIEKGGPLAKFINTIEGQGHGAVFDAKWSPDGNSIAATDSHGHILMFGFGSNERMKSLPKELFFHTDYRPLMRDAQHWVLDEQTQTAPHLMPPPFLVDVEGNPYPPYLQRLVPGREHCPGEQLIPNIAFGDGGAQEVIEGIPAQEPRSDLDLMIAALAQRQYGEAGDMNGDQDNGSGIFNRHMNSPRDQRYRVGMRRHGDVEGVRQSSGNWQHDGNIKWGRRLLVKPLSMYALENAKQKVAATGVIEMEMYRREMRRRPVMISTAAIVPGTKLGRTRGARRNRQAPAYRTRAARSEQIEEEVVNPPSISGDSPSDSDNSERDSTAREEDLQSSGSSSSDSESSGYSDWVADHGETLEPPKRSKRKPVKKRPLTPPSDTDKKRPARKKKVAKIPQQLIEVPEAFRPPEWLSETIPRKAPYYPQMGDEVMYFRQGHQLYLDAVRAKNLYEIGPRSEPWLKTNLRAGELVKVVGIKYEIRPPRLCCLKLALMDPGRQLTGEMFTIKYHDMADVLDFFVLKQTYDTAMARNWEPTNRFRCMIDDGWWLGTIESQNPINDSFPDSPFMCFRVRWDNGEYEHMSPWDLEPVNEDRMPDTVGGAVPVLPEEIQAILYQPLNEEWPGGDREATCRRIIGGLDQVMGLAIAEPFSAPVDLNHYPSYAFVVEYPIDLTTIKARFENHFYRRITSAQFDVRYLATNAEKFNEPHSQIVKQARIVTDLCLRIIKDRNSIDVGAVYHQLVDTYISSESDEEKADANATVNSNEPSTSGLSKSSRMRRSKRLDQPSDWRKEALSLLESLWQCEDSTPFRTPVDTMEHPDYHQLIDTPMDLGTVKEDLLGGNYDSPIGFCKDMRLIFQNSRNYNTNKRSRIYSMTIRLSAMFEEHARRLIYNWKAARRRSNPSRRKTTQAANTPSKMNTRYNGAGPSKMRDLTTSEEEDDDDDRRGTSSSRTKVNGTSNHVQSNSTSSTYSNTRTTANGGPTARPSIKLRISNRLQNNSLDQSDSELDDEDNIENSDSEESSESSDSSETNSDNTPIASLRKSNNKVTQPRRRGRIPKKQRSDSEDSYKPNKTKGKALVNKKTRFKNRPTRKKRTKYNDSDDEDSSEKVPKKRGRKKKFIKSDDEDEDYTDDEEIRKRGKRKKYESDSEFELKPKRSAKKAKKVEETRNDDESFEEEWLDSNSQESKRSSRDNERVTRSQKNVSSIDESSQSSFIRRPRRAKTKTLNHDYNENDDDDENDDLPLVNNSQRRPVRTRQPLYEESKSESDGGSKSEDDDQADEENVQNDNSNVSDPLVDEESDSKQSSIDDRLNNDQDDEDDTSDPLEHAIEPIIDEPRKRRYQESSSESETLRTVRPRRGNKRFNYGENSDDDSDVGDIGTRTRGQDKRNNFSDNYTNNHNDSDENTVVYEQLNTVNNVSSRGRVRKLTARARALLRE
ncbi:bromodomain and WD repeat-containing protein 3 isoform X3 [Chrysoperla carnea]|uniref:bromodomain and WD repeat-containing protein 3 isoform X3 n=1 Tax=Chrysoperla carnea TaxID=189513 RepID=UPI001D085D7D|nr:bromodomain and WD repeat-containing protein 3 isoform X3 [Chrysoperla carnea]